MKWLKLKKNKLKNHKINKYIGMSSVGYKNIRSKDVGLSKSVKSFIEKVRPDIFNFGNFYDKEVNYTFDQIKIFREGERNLHKYTNQIIKNDKQIEISRLTHIQSNTKEKLEKKKKTLKEKSLNISSFIPVIAFIGDSINVFSKLNSILVQANSISIILTIMICLVLDVSPVYLKNLITNNDSGKDKFKIIILSLAMLITSIIYLIICIGTIDSLYSATSIVSTVEKQLTLPQICVAVLISLLPLISTALILGIPAEYKISEMIDYIASYLTIGFDKYRENKISLQIEGLQKDIEIDYENMDEEEYKLVLRDDEVMRNYENYNCKKILVMEVLKSPEVVDMLMKEEEGEKIENAKVN